MAISPPEGFTLTTPPSSTPPEGFNLLNKPAIERPPLPSSEEMFNSPNTWRNDLRSMDVPNRMLLASSAKKVQASQFLSEQTGIKQETIFDNYEQFSQEYRYSGNHEADWQHISGHFKQIRQIKEARAELAASGIRINGKTVEMFPVDFPKEMTPERFGELFKKLSEYNKDQDFAKAALKSKDPKGFVEALKDGGVPVLDLPKELQELQLTLNLAEAFEQDPSLLDDNQLLRLAQNVGEMQRPSTVRGMVGSILTELPEVGLSFFLSGGAGTATKAGLKKSINAVVSKGIQEKIQKNLLTRGITKVAGGAIAAAARTPVASVPFAPKTFIDKLTPDMGFTANEKRELSMIVTGEGKSVPEALKETILDSYIEVASEMVGGAFKPLGQGVKQILVKSAFARAMLNANPTKKVADLAKLVNKTGYHGPLGEMLEERAGDAARALVGLEDWAMPSKNQLLAELIVFSIPAAGLKTADFLLNAGSPGMPAVPSAQQWDGMLNYFTEDQIKERYGEIGVRAAQGDSAAQVEFVDNLMGKDIDPDKVVDIPVKPVDIPLEDITAEEIEGVETKIIPFPKSAPGAAQDEKPLKRTTQLKHASIDDDIRPRLGLDALDLAQRQTSESLYQEVIKENLDEQALGFAVELIKKPVPISAKEHHAMVLAEAKLERLYEEQSAQASEQYALGLNENGDMYSNMAKATLANIDVLTRANRLSGTEISRAFNARKIAIEKERYKLVNLTNKATAFKRESLTQEEKDKLQTLSVKVKEQTAKIAELEAALEKAALEKEEFDAANAVKEFAGVKNQRKKNTARQEREELKEELRKLGMQINDITNTIGLSVEISNILSRIAITHIEEGATTLKEVVRRVQQDVPEASKRDIFNSLGGRVKAETKRVEKEITKRIRELKTQANLEGQIIDAIKGDFDAPMNKKEATKKVKHLRGLLNNLKASAYNTVKDDAQLKKIHLKINEVQDQLTKGYRHIQTKRKESGDITAAKKEYHELKRLMDTLDAISDLQEQLRLGPSHYKISAPRKRVVMNEELNQALVEKKKLEQEIDSTLADLKKNTFWGKTKEVLYTSRAMMAMADFSYALRQAGIFAPRNPILAAKIFGQAFSVTFDHDKALLLDITMRGMPEQIERDKHGLWLSSFDKGIHESEEVFLSRLIDKTPIYRSISRGSERNMVIGLNLFRIAKFDSFIKEHPESTYEQRTAYAHYINVASGRGDLAQLTAVGRQLSALFFAPRFAVSRFQAPWQVVKNWQDPLVRNEILKDFIPFVMTGMAVLTMASLAGLTVELDPEDSDFGKIVWGDTRIDIWGGLLQPARLVLKAILSLGNTTGIRELEEDIDLWDAGNRFLNYKSSPAINLPITLITGKNIINQEQGPVETIMRGMTPLIAQETYDVWENTHRVDKAAAAAAMTALGIGVQEHSDN
jgi:hypothetical protein